MTSDQFGGVVRALLTFAGGAAVSLGYVDSTTSTSAVGALVTLAGIGWSFWSNSQKSMIASINNTENGVHVVPSTVAAGSTVSEPLR